LELSIRSEELKIICQLAIRVRAVRGVILSPRTDARMSMARRMLGVPSSRGRAASVSPCGAVCLGRLSGYSGVDTAWQGWSRALATHVSVAALGGKGAAHHPPLFFIPPSRGRGEAQPRLRMLKPFVSRSIARSAEGRSFAGGASGESKKHQSSGPGADSTRRGVGLLKMIGGLVVVTGAGAGLYVYTIRQRAEDVRLLWQQKKDEIDLQVKNAKGATMAALVTRGAWLAVLFMPVGLTALPAFLIESLREYWYRLLRVTLELSGAAFQKWGQWAATRPDIFPREMCEVMASLHAGVPAHEWAYTEDVLRSAFNGATLEEVFAEIEKVPLGSGSIAQVYKARFASDPPGSYVAIKVRHPRVEERLLLDFELLNAFASAVDLIPGAQWMGLRETLTQFGHTLGAQVRLDFERINLARFHANFSASPQVLRARVTCAGSNLVCVRVLWACD
jgi:hypothetical protein